MVEHVRLGTNIILRCLSYTISYAIDVIVLLVQINSWLREKLVFNQAIEINSSSWISTSISFRSVNYSIDSSAIMIKIDQPSWDFHLARDFWSSILSQVLHYLNW